MPVDADDPDERARLVFDEADVAAMVGNDLGIAAEATGSTPSTRAADPRGRRLGDLHLRVDRYAEGRRRLAPIAAAFVDAESRMFLQDRPIGHGDRVMAGLSVAFDASCEEMWLAWAHGACLVPAPRTLVDGQAALLVELDVARDVARGHAGADVAALEGALLGDEADGRQRARSRSAGGRPAVTVVPPRRVMR